MRARKFNIKHELALKLPQVVEDPFTKRKRITARPARGLAQGNLLRNNQRPPIEGKPGWQYLRDSGVLLDWQPPRARDYSNPSDIEKMRNEMDAALMKNPEDMSSLEKRCCRGTQAVCP